MPIFDAHACYGRPPGSPLAWDPQRYLQLMDRFQIERTVFSSWFAELCDFARGNAELDEVLSQQERWLGYLSVNAHYPEESMAELQKYLGKGRFVGVRFHCALHRQALAAPDSLEILSACRRYGAPVLVSAPGAPEVRQVAEVAQEYTTLRFILTEMDPPGWELALRLLETQTQVYLGIGSPHTEVGKLAAAAASVGTRRLLFTSGSGQASIPCAVGLMRDAGLGRSDQERIASRNAAEVFGFQPRGLPEWMEE